MKSVYVYSSFWNGCLSSEHFEYRSFSSTIISNQTETFRTENQGDLFFLFSI